MLAGSQTPTRLSIFDHRDLTGNAGRKGRPPHEKRADRREHRLVCHDDEVRRGAIHATMTSAFQEILRNDFRRTGGQRGEKRLRENQADVIGAFGKELGGLHRRNVGARHDDIEDRLITQSQLVSNRANDLSALRRERA